jgi:vanillate O-demethylase ferredoxin subunit
MWIPVRINRKRAEADGIASFELVPECDGKLPAFSAGAHIDVEVASGVVRQYSLCNAPWERHRYQIGVLEEEGGRGGSRAMHQHREGDLIRIGEPRNLFELHSHATHSLLFAGGIGITPLLAMAEQLAAQDASFEMHYCVRHDRRIAFKDRLAAGRLGVASRIHLGDGPEAQRLQCGEVLASAPVGAHLYVCGPKGFMDHVIETARSSGWHEDRIHREFFKATPVDHAADGSFEIQLKSGRIVKVAADETAAQALLNSGVEVPLSCEQGVCGTCLTRVLDGVPDHRDMFLSDEEHAANDCFTPCCSRAKGPRLVLDIE